MNRRRPTRLYETGLGPPAPVATRSEETRMLNPFRVGRRVYFRPLERADAPLVQGWFNDPEVTRTLLRTGPMSLAAEEAFIDRIGQSDTDLAAVIALRDTDRPIGVTGLHPID